jgi:hypothetical protein
VVDAVDELENVRDPHVAERSLVADAEDVREGESVVVALGTSVRPEIVGVSVAVNVDVMVPECAAVVDGVGPVHVGDVVPDLDVSELGVTVGVGEADADIDFEASV